MEIPTVISDGSVRVPEEQIPVWRKTGVLVLGDAAAAVIAATVSATRLGADVTPINLNDHMGDGDGHQVVRGGCLEGPAEWRREADAR